MKRHHRLLLPLLTMLLLSLACQLPVLGDIMVPPPSAQARPTPAVTPVFTTQPLTRGNSTSAQEILVVATGDPNPIAALAFSPDAQELVAVHGLSGHVARWLTADGRPIRTIEVGPVGVAAADFDGNGVMLAISAGETEPASEAGYAAEFKGAKVWNTLTGELVWQDPLGDDVFNLPATDVAMSWDGHIVLFTMAGGYDISDVFENRALRHVTIGYMEPLRPDRPPAVTAAALDSVSEWMAWAHDGGLVSLETWERPLEGSWQLVPGVQESPLALTIDPKRQYAAMITTESLMVWKLQSWSHKPVWKQSHGYTAAAAVEFSPDSRLLAIGTENGWELRSVEDGRLLVQHPQATYAIAFSADGHLIGWGDTEGKVHVWGVLDD